MITRCRHECWSSCLIHLVRQLHQFKHKADTLLFFMCAMKSQILIGYVNARQVNELRGRYQNSCKELVDDQVNI